MTANSRPNGEIPASTRSQWYRSDSLAVAVLIALCAAAALLRWIHADWMSGYDGFDYFMPNWSYMGERLRGFEVPGWNPYASSGTPFAGDPGTGWLYLPIMFSFTLLKAVAAWKFLLLLLSTICGLSAYIFARRIGLEPIAALFASASFAIGAVTYGLATDRIAITTTFVPITVGLLAAEMAIRSNRVSGFLGWTALGGIALSQNFGAWPAQGIIYSAMYIGGWLAYRWLFALPPEISSRREMFKRVVAFGVGIGVVTLAFGAAAILPLVDVTGQSTISGGDYSQAFNGQPVSPTNPMLNFAALLFQDTPYYRLSTAGGAVVILALFAVTCFRNRYGVPFFLVAGYVFIDIASNESITRWLFYLVPFFEQAHAHRPTASSAFVFPALNLLAGAGIQLMLDESRLRRIFQSVAISLAALAVLLFALDQKDIHIGSWPIVLTLVASLLILLIAWLRLRPTSTAGPAFPRLLATAFIAFLIVYPTGLDYSRIWNGTGRTPGLEDVNIPASDVEWVVDTSVKTSDPGTAAEFLQRQRDTQQPFRYAAYYGADTVSGQHLPYVYRRLDPFIVFSLSGSRSPFLELEQVSTYNPIHMKYYTEYFEFMQEQQQDYHFVDVFYRAFDNAQLFAMLNIRYVVVATNVSRVLPIASYGTEVYRDESVIIYENPYAFDRAWIVHEVLPAMEGNLEMKLLNQYQVDGHTVAYVDGDIPPTTPLAEGAAPDSVFVVNYEPESITLRAKTSADGMVVLSEVYADGWNAYVDGKKVDILRTNLSLRGVPITAGDHEIVLKYELKSLQIGLWSTGFTSLGILAVWSWALVDKRRSTKAAQSDATRQLDSGDDSNLAA